jgi:uncharacterized delta-60 repeat protein
MRFCLLFDLGAGVAQLVEHWFCKPACAGSSPASGLGMNRVLALALALAAVLPAGAAADARPDRSFGDGGYATLRLPGKTTLAYDAAVAPGGKIVVAGQASTRSGDSQVVVARYRSDGRLDRGFGKRGVFQTDFPANRGPYLGTAVVVEEGTRKPVVAGGYGQGSMLLMRLTRKGRYDRSFGVDYSDGTSTVSVGGIADSLAVLPDGSFVLGGSNANANGRPMVVARFNSDGTVSDAFPDGSVDLMFWDPSLASSAGTLGLIPGQNGTVTGFGHLDYIGSDGHGSAGIFQLDQSGDLVPGFGTEGHVEVDFPQANGSFAFWFPCAMGVDGQGRVTVTGAGTGGILTTRITPEGVPDPAYGPSGDGRVVTPGTKSDDQTTCGATVDADGGLIAGVDDVLMSLTPAGAPDASFAPGGTLAVKRPSRVTINAVAPDGADRLVVAGSAGNSVYVGRFRVPAGS